MGEASTGGTSRPARDGAFMGLGAAQVHDAGDPTRFIPAQGGNYRHIRHAEILARWPVLAEPWAQRVETGRLN
jgi:hypothetical protein